MKRIHAGVFVAVPVLLAAVFASIEYALLFRNGAEGQLLKTLTEAQKKVVDLDLELAKLFIATALSLIGLSAFYLKSSVADWTPKALVALAAVLFFSVVSIFFGHLWISALRDQLARNVLVPDGTDVAWSERLQYGFLLVGLCLAALVVVEQHLVRKTEGTKSVTITVISSDGGVHLNVEKQGKG